MRTGFLVSVVLLVLQKLAESAPYYEGGGGLNSAMLYLSQYGYLGISPSKILNSSSLIDGSVFNEAVADFQSFAGLDVTGELDTKTLEVMSLPRCGVKDKVGSGSDSRSKRYALQGSRWKTKSLTYKISKYPPKLKRKDVDAEIQRAFNVWSEYTDLTFKPVSGAVHIEIRFEEGEHGDGDPFDGPGGTLAHAYFPVFGGDAHFDASEQWSIGSYRGTNLFQVAAHEFGHSLGLSHSDVRSALMAPFYRGYDPVFSLDIDDIQGIQALYGKKTRKSSGGGGGGGNKNDDPVDEEESGGDDYNDNKSTPSGEDQVLCKNPKVDTIFNTADGNTYVFKGNHYWKLTEDAVAKGYPKIISKGWPGLPGNLDGAFTYKNGKTYFFKGKQYWRYNGRKVDGDYPKDISEGFTGIPDDIDSVMVWSGNGKIYFFKGSKFWRFDPSQRPPVKSTYPKPLANWEGVPNNIDAAFQYTNGYTYFYKDNAYYRFNDRMFAVDPVNPAFPRSTAFWWFGCKSATRGTLGTDDSRGFLQEEGSESDVGSQSVPVENEDSFDAGNHQLTNSTDCEDISRGGVSRSLASIALTILAVLVASS